MTGVAWWVPLAIAFCALVFAAGVLVLLVLAARGVWRLFRPYQPGHAASSAGLREWVPWDEPRGSMILAEERRVQVPRLGASIGGSYDAEGRWIDHWHQPAPDAPREYDDVSELEPVDMPDWMREAAREVAHDWREQTAHDLAPAVLDSGLGASLAQAVTPSPDFSGGGGVPGSAHEPVRPTLPPRPPEPEPEPEVRTVAGRLIETSDEWLRRLVANAAPGWTYAGTVAA